MNSAPMPCAFVLSSVIALAGCGPSPALAPSTPAHARRVAPAGHVVAVVPCDDDEIDDEPPALTGAKPVEYVRLDEWEPPPSVKEIEARIEPRGDKPPEYVDLPRLKMHREIVPMTTYRRGYYWP